MTVIIRLPETYRHDHFHLIVTKKSDRAQLAQIAKDFREQTDDLEKAVVETTPKTP